MKLSEAIRLGAMLRPQAFSASTRHGTCAVYAALDAIGQFNNRRYEFFPILNLEKQQCPECGSTHYGYSTLAGTIFHLNDEHHWTRERIADWVATIEPADAPQPQEQPCDQHSSIEA